MRRWYKCFTFARYPREAHDQIRRVIEENGLQRIMPVAHIQRHAYGMPKPYYLFLAIVSDTPGAVPSEVKSALIRLPWLTPFPDQEVFTFKEIEAFVNTDAYDYTLTIQYKEPPPPPDDMESLVDVEPPAGPSELAEAYHRLLLWLSSAGSGSWAAFREACRALGLVGEHTTPRSIFRSLKLLGHVEASVDGSQWCVAPPALVQPDTASGAGEFFLCGARDEAVLTRLRNCALVALVQQPYAAGAPAVAMRLPEAMSVPETFPVQVAGQVARRLAELLPTVTTWRQGLIPVPNVRPDIQAPNRFNGYVFEPAYFSGQPGLYEFPSSGNGRPARYLLYDAAAQLWRSGEWYGLRYLALLDGGRPCPVCYSANTGRVAVPVEWRWPEVYERTLVLASGVLPTYRGAWLIYETISRETLDLLTPKLNLRVEETEAYA